MKALVMLMLLFTAPAFADYGRTITETTRDITLGENFLTVLFQVGSEPVYVEDTLIGYRMINPDKGSVFDLLGIRDGDVITHLEGHELSDLSIAYYFLEYARTADEVTYSMIREGQFKQVTVTVVRE